MQTDFPPLRTLDASPGNLRAPVTSLIGRESEVAEVARKKTDRDPARKWAHLTELARQRDVEAAGRAAVADLYEREGNWGTKTLRMGAAWPLVFPCAAPTLNSSPTASP